MATISKPDAQKKVYELTEKLIFIKKDFKDVSAGYKEKIKELRQRMVNHKVVHDAAVVELSAVETAGAMRHHSQTG